MFGFNFDKRTMIIIMIIMAGIWILSAGTNGVLKMLFAIPGVLIAMTFHEYAHAYAATKLRR